MRFLRVFIEDRAQTFAVIAESEAVLRGKSLYLCIARLTVRRPNATQFLLVYGEVIRRFQLLPDLFCKFAHSRDAWGAKISRTSCY